MLFNYHRDGTQNCIQHSKGSFMYRQNSFWDEYMQLYPVKAWGHLQKYYQYLILGIPISRNAVFIIKQGIGTSYGSRRY